MKAITGHVAIIGAGIMGLSTARALVKRGCRVSLFDQGPIPNPQSASYDEHRLIRYPYGSQVGYMQMVHDAYRAWGGVWRDLGVCHYEQTGTLLIGASHRGWVADSKAALSEAGIQFETLDARTMPSRFPYLSADDVHVALFLPSGGVLLASRILDDLQRYLRSRGVAIHDQNAITELDDATVYFADGTTLEADLVVVAAGAWLPRFLPAIAHEVIPSRQTVVYFDLPVEAHDAWRTRPMILDIDKDSGFYLVPPVAGASLKVGDHRFNLTGDPRNQTRPEASEIEPIVRSTLHRLPEFANYPILRSDVCFYTVAPDERFRYVRQGRFRVVTGFSGHGFKFGPLIGERLAEMLFEERPELAFKRWLAGF